MSTRKIVPTSLSTAPGAPARPAAVSDAHIYTQALPGGEPTPSPATQPQMTTAKVKNETSWSAQIKTGFNFGLFHLQLSGGISRSHSEETQEPRLAIAPTTATVKGPDPEP